MIGILVLHVQSYHVDCKCLRCYHYCPSYTGVYCSVCDDIVTSNFVEKGTFELKGCRMLQQKKALQTIMLLSSRRCLNASSHLIRLGGRRGCWAVMCCGGWCLPLMTSSSSCLLFFILKLSTHYLHSTPTTSFLSATTSPLIHVGINTNSPRVWKNRCQFWRRGCHLDFRGQW